MDQAIPAPVNPLTLQINLAVLRYVRGNFFSKYLPTFRPVVTSDLRSQEHNEAIGGAKNSAHLHGLAEDFQLSYLTGAVIPEAQARAVYDQFIAPNWPGFSEFEGAGKNEGYHVHVNLSREISTYSSIFSLVGLGVLGYTIVSNWSRISK